MKTKVYTVIMNILLFWAVTDVFSGIVVKEGVLGYLICGGIFGIGMLLVEPLIRFFTLPVKFITLIMISLMVSVMVYFLLNLGVPFIDFKDGALVGLTNRYFSIEKLGLDMMGNVLVGGLINGLLSASLTAFLRAVKKE